ncbi:MAG: hypothetical protein AAFQ82_23170 [Myxococcota bacterium]
MRVSLGLAFLGLYLWHRDHVVIVAVDLAKEGGGKVARGFCDGQRHDFLLTPERSGPCTDIFAHRVAMLLESTEIRPKLTPSDGSLMISVVYALVWASGER